MPANVNRDTGLLASAGASARWTAKPCISYRIAPRSGFTPLLVLLHLTALKTPATNLLNTKEGQPRRTAHSTHNTSTKIIVS